MSEMTKLRCTLHSSAHITINKLYNSIECWQNASQTAIAKCHCKMSGKCLAGCLAKCHGVAEIITVLSFDAIISFDTIMQLIWMNRELEEKYIGWCTFMNNEALMCINNNLIVAIAYLDFWFAATCKKFMLDVLL